MHVLNKCFEKDLNLTNQQINLKQFRYPKIYEANNDMLTMEGSGDEILEPVK